MPNAQAMKALGLRDTCENRRGVLRIPAVVETVAAPVTHAVVPEQVPNVQVAVRTATNSAPEVDVPRAAVLVDLPIFRNQLWMEPESALDGEGGSRERRRSRQEPYSSPVP